MHGVLIKRVKQNNSWISVSYNDEMMQGKSRFFNLKQLIQILTFNNKHKSLLIQ